MDALRPPLSFIEWTNVRSPQHCAGLMVPSPVSLSVEFPFLLHPGRGMGCTFPRSSTLGQSHLFRHSTVDRCMGTML